ncbi:MAG: hypothetical protein QOF25_1564 [Mycobacterium sp.]|nr:hypothetical protein [Mycobacterium sp.]
MVRPAALLGATPVVIPAPAWLREQTLDRAVVDVPEHGTKVSGPEDDESWWPPRNLDGDGLDQNGAAAAPGKSTSTSTRRRGRAGVGAALVLLGVGGAAVLATPAAFRVGPVDDSGPLTPSSTSTIITTTPSIAQRPAPSDTPAMLPPAVVTTTTAIVVAPTTETTYDPRPTQEPVTTAEPEPSTPEPSTPKPTPPNQVPKQPPQQQGPSCPPQNPECNDGAGPVFS